MTTSMEDIKRRMDSTLKSLNEDFAGLRTGRASASMLDNVVVEAYGGTMPLNQVGTVNVMDNRMLSVQVWDKEMVKSVDKAIRESGLGLNPQIEGQVMRIPVPELSGERRKELSKVAAKYAENAKVAIRNVRRDGMDWLKKEEKDGKISEDQQHGQSEQIQKLTDDHIKKIEEAAVAKEKDIMQV